MTLFEIDQREWLEADGLGGFAMGTVSGVRTRRYHALLLAATTPPTGRMVLVNGFDAWVETAGRRVALSSQRSEPAASSIPTAHHASSPSRRIRGRRGRSGSKTGRESGRRSSSRTRRRRRGDVAARRCDAGPLASAPRAPDRAAVSVRARLSLTHHENAAIRRRRPTG